MTVVCLPGNPPASKRLSSGAPPLPAATWRPRASACASLQCAWQSPGGQRAGPASCRALPCLHPSCLQASNSTYCEGLELEYGDSRTVAERSAPPPPWAPMVALLRRALTLGWPPASLMFTRPPGPLPSPGPSPRAPRPLRWRVPAAAAPSAPPTKPKDEKPACVCQSPVPAFARVRPPSQYCINLAKSRCQDDASWPTFQPVVNLPTSTSASPLPSVPLEYATTHLCLSRSSERALVPQTLPSNSQKPRQTHLCVCQWSGGLHLAACEACCTG